MAEEPSETRQIIYNETMGPMRRMYQKTVKMCGGHGREAYVTFFCMCDSNRIGNSRCNCRAEDRSVDWQSGESSPLLEYELWCPNRAGAGMLFQQVNKY